MFLVATVQRPDRHLLNFFFRGHVGLGYGLISVVEIGNALSAATQNWPSYLSMKDLIGEDDQIHAS